MFLWRARVRVARVRIQGRCFGAGSSNESVAVCKILPELHVALQSSARYAKVKMQGSQDTKEVMVVPKDFVLSSSQVQEVPRLQSTRITSVRTELLSIDTLSFPKFDFFFSFIDNRQKGLRCDAMRLIISDSHHPSGGVARIAARSVEIAPTRVGRRYACDVLCKLQAFRIFQRRVLFSESDARPDFSRQSSLMTWAEDGLTCERNR